MKKVEKKLELPREFAASLAQAGQLPLYEGKNELMNQLVAKGLGYYKVELEKAQKEIFSNQQRILMMYNRQNMALA